MTVSEKGAQPKRQVTDTGELRLRQLGYKQELSRTLNTMVNFAVSYTIIGVLMGITGLYSLGFEYGGPVSVVWGWVVVSFFTLFIAASMAEICSSYPTAGGLYFWSYSLAGPKYGPLCSWLTGWFNYLGFVCGMAAIDHIGATIISTMVVLNTGTGLDGGYVASKEVTLAFLAGILVLQAIINSFHVNVLAFVEKAALYIEVGGLIIIVVTLFSVADRRQSAKYVFTHYEPAVDTGVHNSFYVFLLGMLMSSFTLLAYDAATHLTEETVGADWTSPVSIVSAVATAAVAGFIYILTLTFCIQDPATLLDPGNATAGLSAAAQIFYDVFDSAGKSPKGVIALLTIPLMASYFSGMSQLAATSRVLFAITRDKAIPFSGFLHWTHPKSKTPIVAVWVSAALAFCFALFSLKSYIAFTAVTSLSTIGSMTAYGIPIFLKQLFPHNFHPGPFNLGRFSPIVGWVAIIYIVFMVVVFCLPTYYPIDSNTLNYAPVTGGAVILVALFLWVIVARKRYLGPVRTLRAEDSKTDETYSGGNLYPEPVYKNEYSVHGKSAPVKPAEAA
ncbi:amino acid transporter protein [Klebsormidium nitens]|uniref:Amino acid transporter protein n=1 Tax=Klebsormidium nitens TaxID=105231 RepID=A0A1Y1HPY4_KLENI|nr:amino acid transporter protein [Klebsormidium nitens]|eukprot:GAQ79259.1 amino acid transporter protein [Klebsormidium nitens]